jgi:hypothetical protein
MVLYCQNLVSVYNVTHENNKNGTMHNMNTLVLHYNDGLL